MAFLTKAYLPFSVRVQSYHTTLSVEGLSFSERFLNLSCPRHGSFSLLEWSHLGYCLLERNCDDDVESMECIRPHWALINLIEPIEWDISYPKSRLTKKENSRYTERWLQEQKQIFGDRWQKWENCNGLPRLFCISERSSNWLPTFLYHKSWKWFSSITSDYPVAQHKRRNCWIKQWINVLTRE